MEKIALTVSYIYTLVLVMNLSVERLLMESLWLPFTLKYIAIYHESQIFSEESEKIIEKWQVILDLFLETESL